MSNVFRLFDNSNFRRCSDTEALISKAVVTVVGNAAQLARLKMELSRHLDAIDEVAFHLEDGELKSTMIRESAQHRTQLDTALLALAQTVQQLPVLHNQLAYYLPRYLGQLAQL